MTLVAMTLAALLADAASCEKLKSLSLPNTTFTTAQMVAAGLFTAPAARPARHKVAERVGEAARQLRRPLCFRRTAA